MNNVFILHTNNIYELYFCHYINAYIEIPIQYMFIHL